MSNPLKDEILKQIKEMETSPFFLIIPADAPQLLAEGKITKKQFAEYVSSLPRYRNPKMREVMIQCECGHRYVDYLFDPTETSPIPDIPEGCPIICPACSRPIDKWVRLWGHSGGSFNAMRGRDHV